MGLFEDQIRQRQDADNAVFEDSFLHLTGAVMGRRFYDALSDDRQITTDAIGDILKYYRVKPREVPESIRDVNEVLEYQLRPHGIMHRPVNLDRGWHRDAVGAMMGRRKDDGSIVALLPIGMGGYYFYDRKTGKKVMIKRKGEELIEREAIAFYKPFPLKKLGMIGMLRYMMGQFRASDIVMLLFMMLIVALVGMLSPKLTIVLFSDVLYSGDESALLGAGIFLVCSVISGLMFKAVQTLVLARIEAKMSVSVEAASMMRLLSLPADFFKDYSAGELANRAMYLTMISKLIVSVALASGLTATFSLIYIVQIVSFAPALVWPAVLITLFTFLVTVISVMWQVQITRLQMLQTSKENGMSYGLITGIQKIRLAGAEKRAFARWSRLYARSARLQYNPPVFLRISSVITLGISLLGTMLIYYVALKNDINVAEFYAFNSAYGMMNTAFLSLASITASLAQIRPMLDMVRPIMEAVPEISQDKRVITRLSGSVELNNVTFRYSEDMPPVLDNISLKIRSGQYVAIVGRTGCGKSTLMRILLGFETPQKGAVYYDGQDLKTLDLKSLRHNIGSVMQDGKLFTADIFSNIIISAPWLKQEDAWEAAEIAGMADEIRALPMGMHTMISEGQGGISGGQRQRLLIARAIAPKPKILMFDEATSALDNLTQTKVSNALDAMKCTRIVIAHRLSTIRQCDRIIVLENGGIVEDGTYEELMEKNGAFADLVSRQQLDEGKKSKAQA